MTNRSASEGQHDRRSAREWLPPWLVVLGLMWGIVLVGMWGAVAMAATDAGPVVLQGVDISPLAGNRLQLRFRLSAPPKAPPSSFTINEPARIVLDFLDTTNGLSARQQSINVGVADKISVLEGADRTRASLNLARLVPYNVQVQGNLVVLTLENAGATPTRTPAPTPAAAVKAAAASVRQTDAEGPVTTPRMVSDVGFKRGPAGQGVVTIKLSNPNIPVDVRQEGNQIVADFQKATLARGQERRLDVTDFATPVTTLEALNRGGSARLSIRPNPPFEYMAYQANDLYVIEVRPPQKSKEEEDKEAQFDPSKKKYTGDLLSLNFQDIEVRAILQILADFTGLNIVVSDSVKGNLTLRLQNVPWDQALDIILRTKGLAMRQNGNVIFIAPTEEVAAREKLDLESRKTVQELIPLRTEIIQVNYAKAKDLAELLKRRNTTDKSSEQSVLSPRGDVVADERTNSLIVKDVPDKVAEVRDMVTKLDVPAKQVMVDSRIVIASDDFARDIGVRFGVSGVGTNGNNTVSTVSGGLNGTNSMLTGKKPDESGSNITGVPGDDVGVVGNLINTGQPYPAIIPALNDRLGVNLPVAGPSIALAILGSNYLVDLELSALQTEGKGEVLSNPRVVTADLKKATIIQGRQIPYSVVSDEGVTTLFRDALLKLEVTPQITPDDRVRMDLMVSKDEPGPPVPQATGGFALSIEKREVTTQVLVNNGETVVLGGVFEHTKTNSQDKVPLLGDIPLLGYLFQRNGKATAKRELLIFVTPQILKNGAVTER